MYENILVVGSEIHSGGLDKSSRGRSVSVIFGDGAGAAIVSKSNDESEILSTHLHSEGKFAEELAVIKPATTFWIDKIIDDGDEDGEGFFPKMNGNFVFKNAVKRFEEVIFESLNHNNYTSKDIDMLITHQANLRLSHYIQKKLNIDENPETPQAYNVRGIPTLLIFKSGEMVAEKIGAMPKSALEQWVADNL